MPIFCAAPLERSRLRPRTYGPQSLIRTVTDRPFRGFSTLTKDPSGNVLEAAVIRFGSKRSPLAVVRPANSAPYQEAFTTFAGRLVGWGGVGWGGGTVVSARGGGVTRVAHPGMANKIARAKIPKAEEARQPGTDTFVVAFSNF